MEGVFCTLSKYCSENDFVSALQTISDDISVVNLPPIPEYNNEDPGLTIAPLINTVWSLLQHRQQFVDSQHNLTQKLYVLSQDLNDSKEKLKRLEKSLLNNQDSLLKEKKKALLSESQNSEIFHHSKCLKQEIKDVKEGIAGLQPKLHYNFSGNETDLNTKIQELKQELKAKDNQFKHVLQRQQIEISELQSKLRKILSKEKGEKWRGPVDNSDKHKLADNDKLVSMELVYQKSIHRLEHNVHTLVKENLELRKLLDNVSEDLAQLMSKTSLEPPPL